MSINSISHSLKNIVMSSQKPQHPAQNAPLPAQAKNSSQANTSFNVDLGSKADVTAQAKINTQMIAQKSNNAQSLGVQAFNDFMNMARNNPGGLLFAQFLASEGINEDDIENMTAEELKDLQEKFEALLEKKQEQKELEAESNRINALDIKQTSTKDDKDKSILS